MAGDQTLFHRMDMVEAGWQIVAADSRRMGRAISGRRFRRYRPGTLGTSGSGCAASSATAGNGVCNDRRRRDRGRRGGRRSSSRARRARDGTRSRTRDDLPDRRPHAGAALPPAGRSGAPWRERIDWPSVHLFWSDERHVPPDHPDSNYGMAARALISHVPIPPDTSTGYAASCRTHRERPSTYDDGAERRFRAGAAAAIRRST